jgi:hypothetical protein
MEFMPREHRAGKPTTKRYSGEEKAVGHIEPGVPTSHAR